MFVYFDIANFFDTFVFLACQDPLLMQEIMTLGVSRKEKHRSMFPKRKVSGTKPWRNIDQR